MAGNVCRESVHHGIKLVDPPAIEIDGPMGTDGHACTAADTQAGIHLRTIDSFSIDLDPHHFQRALVIALGDALRLAAAER